MACHALVIEDDHTLQLVLAEILSDLGFQVSPAKNGREAMDVLEHQMPDLVTLDLNIPGASALSILQRIRQSQQGHRTTAVLFSGDRPNDHADEVALANLYLKKPDGIAELVALAQEVIYRAEDTVPDGTTIRQQARQQNSTYFQD